MDDKSKQQVAAWVAIPDTWEEAEAESDDEEESEEKKAPDRLELEKTIEVLNTKVEKLTLKMQESLTLYNSAFAEAPEVVQDEGLVRRAAEVNTRRLLVELGFNQSQEAWDTQIKTMTADKKPFPVEDAASLLTLSEVNDMKAGLLKVDDAEQAKTKSARISDALDGLFKLQLALKDASRELKRAYIRHKKTHGDTKDATHQKKRSTQQKAQAKSIAKKAMNSAEMSVFKVSFKDIAEEVCVYANLEEFGTAKDEGSVPTTAPYMISSAEELAGLIRANAGLASCLDIFRMQFPLSKRAKAIGRTQAPPPVARDEAIVAKLAECMPYRSIHEFKHSGAQDDKAASKQLPALSMYGFTAKRPNQSTEQMQFVGPEILSSGTVRYQMEGSRHTIAVNFCDVLDYIVHDLCGDHIKVEDLSLAGVYNVVRSFDATVIKDMAALGIKFWSMDVPAKAVTVTPMGMLLIEKTTKTEHCMGLRTNVWEICIVCLRLPISLVAFFTFVVRLTSICIHVFMLAP